MAVAEGWLCPKCQRIIAPFVTSCPFCAPPPALVGLGEAGPERGRCPDCHMPLTMHCDPMCSQPCGRCEARKAAAAEAERLVIRLPLVMGDLGHVRQAQLGPEWLEVLPGLEACIASVAVGTGPNKARVQFRLTPDG